MAVIRFGKQTIEAEPGRDLLGQLLDAGAPIAYICMSGSCGTCAVKVLAGSEHLSPMTQAERLHLPKSTGCDRLACQAESLGTGDVDVDQ